MSRLEMSQAPILWYQVDIKLLKNVTVLVFNGIEDTESTLLAFMGPGECDFSSTDEVRK